MLQGLPNIVNNRSTHWLLFIVIGIVLYGFTLNYPFVFDDRIYILGNPLLKDTDAFLNLFDIDEFIDIYLNKVTNQDLAVSFVLRPMTYLSFHLNTLFFGINTAGFRAFNIAIHIANAILLYQLLLSLIQRRNDLPQSLSRLTIPFFSAMFFLVHPLQTQSVTYITQRFTSMATLFYLVTMLLYLRSTEEIAGNARRYFYAGSIVTLTMGLLTKEIVFTAPIALLMLEVILLRRPWRGAIKRLAPHFLCMSIIPLQVIRVSAELSDTNNLISSATDIVGGIYSRSDYAITQIRAILSYIRLLLLPYNQNFDPDYPLYRSLLHPEIILSIIIWSLIMMAGVSLLRRKDRNVCIDLSVFSIFWFPLAISVSSSFVPLSDLMFEHRSYLPSVAFFIGSNAFLFNAVADSGVYRQKIVTGVLCLLLVIYGGLTIHRNHAYSRRITLWQDTVTKNPKKSRPYFSLGNSYLDKNRFEEAITCFDKSLALDPLNVNAYESLGSAYLLTGKPQKAIELYEEYLRFLPPVKKILMNLALAYSESGRYQDAVNTIMLVLPSSGSDARLLGFISEMNLRIGRLEMARKYYSHALEADLNDTTVDLSAMLDFLKEQIIEATGRNSSSPLRRDRLTN